MKEATKSPIKDKPLRTPGQSLEEKAREIMDEEILWPALTAMSFLLFAAWEWARSLLNTPPHPVIASITALIAMGYAAWKTRNARLALRAIRQGIDGEKSVGQYLERLRQSGYRIFHDLVDARFNVDHVLVGPAGVFTIETKTWSKPVRGKPEIVFNGETIVRTGYKPERGPVDQAKAQASWLKGVLVESLGLEFEVFPVVVFPGWFVKQLDGSLRNIWVLEPKALAKFLGNEPPCLSPDEVSLISSHLSRYIRSCERERSK